MQDPGHRKIKEDKARGILLTDHRMHVYPSQFFGDPFHSKLEAFRPPGFLSTLDYSIRHADSSRSKIKEHKPLLGWSRSSSYAYMPRLPLTARNDFRTRRQKQGESIEKFAAVLRELVEQCDFLRYEKDHELRTQFVNGLRSMHIRDHLDKRHGINFERAVDIASMMEVDSLSNRLVDRTRSKTKEDKARGDLSPSHSLDDSIRCAARSDFRARRQKQGESIKKFAAVLRELVEQCHFSTDEKNHELLTQFVNGLRSMHIRDHLDKRHGINFEIAVDIASMIEGAKSGDRPTARFEFRTRRQKQGERIEKFAAVLRKFAKLCNFSRVKKDQELVAQFVNGLRSMHIRDALEKRSLINFEMTVAIASRMEDINSGVRLTADDDDAGSSSQERTMWMTGDSEVKEKKPRSIERADQKLTADRLQDELVKSLLPHAIKSRDITKLVAESSASCTQQVESGISRLDECLSELKKTGLGLDIRMKLLLTICDTCMFAGQFHKAAEIVKSEELTSADMTPLNCQTRVVYLRLLCCAAEANALLYNREQVKAYYLTAENIIQDLPQKLNDDVYKNYKEVRCRLDEIEKLISNYHRDHRNSITQRVGEAGGVLELPDCSIYFPNNSFLQSTLVHAMTTEVSDDMPPSMVPVTPVLRLSPNTDLLDPAIVKLVTWVSSENPVLIHVYHKQSENSTWSALRLPPTYSKGNSRIEFQITQFCSFCGFLGEKMAHRKEFKIMSRLFFSKERKELANRLFPCCDTHKEAVKTEMREKSFSEQACSTDPILTIRRNDEVEVTLIDVKQTNDDKSQGRKIKSVRVKIVLDNLKRAHHRPQNLFLPVNLDGLIEFNHSVKQFRDGKILDGEDNQHQDRIDLGNSGVDNRGANINAQLNNPIFHVNKNAHIAERDGLHDHRQIAMEERAGLKIKNGNSVPPLMTRHPKDVAKQIDSAAHKEDSLGDTTKNQSFASSTTSKSEAAASKPKKRRRR